MLYDPKWDETKADPFSLESLIAWLEKQPRHRAYEWRCWHGGCLLGKYSQATGVDFRDCHTAFFKRRELHIAHREPHTFGAALTRARAVLTERVA